MHACRELTTAPHVCASTQLTHQRCAPWCPSQVPSLQQLIGQLNEAGDLLKKGGNRYQVSGVSVQPSGGAPGGGMGGYSSGGMGGGMCGHSSGGGAYSGGGYAAGGAGGAQPAASQQSAGSKRSWQQAMPPPPPRW